ncbi:DgyrCDS13846 [Dimorphilus gyrociliatus]|uniref:DgyrCDS13846 n=1 Tax=Dimorphilus gyrociliatus TaxID=2664684 RepID=A0A7I8WBZ6_9ANNE|nr:DgyrCDS13846 [Dimorphilus gyrociliatus]
MSEVIEDDSIDMNKLNQVLKSLNQYTEYDILAREVLGKDIVVFEDKVAFSVELSTSIARNALKKLFHSNKELDNFEVCRLSTILLLFFPDVNSAWNRRRHLILTGFLQPKDELIFSSLILGKFPKCFSAFCYRRFIITRCGLCLEDIVQKEVEVCDKTARLYSNNYYSWTHRIWFVQLYCKSSAKKSELLTTEFSISKKYVEYHISDYSGLQYRQFLLSLMNECLKEELYFTDSLIRIYSEHESLWYHKRYVLNQILKGRNNLERKDLIENEKLFIDDLKKRL